MSQPSNLPANAIQLAGHEIWFVPATLAVYEKYMAARIEEETRDTAPDVLFHDVVVFPSTYEAKEAVLEDFPAISGAIAVEVNAIAEGRGFQAPVLSAETIGTVKATSKRAQVMARFGVIIRPASRPEYKAFQKTKKT